MAHKGASPTSIDVEAGVLPLSPHLSLPKDDDMRMTHDADVYPVSQATVGPNSIDGNMKVTFKDLTYIVRNNGNKNERITLLNKVSGFLLPGHLSALMGPSGSSKTTLLDVLAGRKTVGQISGKITFAGQHGSRVFLRRYTGYVEQFDAMIENLTVYEMLLYTAEMKLSMDIPVYKKKEKVAAVLDMLALGPCRDVRIGSPLARGISGGQCKRTNIGIALVSNPRVLFLDEPTSGLDSYTSNEVMTVVKTLVRSGITICATIHSPTPYCFNLFDSLMILLRGHVVYFGPNGPSAIEYFESQFPSVTPFTIKGMYHNKAEWIVDLTTKADREGRYADFAKVYAESDLHESNLDILEDHMNDPAKISDEMQKELAVDQETTNPVWWGVITLLRYRMGRDIQDINFLGPRLLDKFVLSLIVMSLYWRVGANAAPSNVNNITAVLFLWTILPGYAAASYMPTIVLERPLYVRERNDGLYRAVTYLTAKMVEELSVFFLLSLLLTALVFAPCKLGGSYMLFWMVNLVTTATGVALGYFIAAVSPNMDVANAALPAYVTVLLFFVGLLLRPQDQPVYWHWFSYLDFLKYAWAAQMINQFENSHALALDFHTVLQFYDLEGQSKWANLGYECLFFLAFVFFAWLALAFKRHLRR